MKRYFIILLTLLPLFVSAQLVQPVKWSGEEIGDSVRIKAAIEPGWHMNIIEFGEREFDEEFADSFVITLAANELSPIRFNACDDKMCTAPETWEFQDNVQSDKVQGTKDRSLLWILVLGFLGGLLAIFTPCVWPIIPMTVSFFLKKGGGKRDAILYGFSIIDMCSNTNKWFLISLISIFFYIFIIALFNFLF